MFFTDFSLSLPRQPCYNISMKHITLKTEEKLYQSRTLDFYFKGMRIGVLDIETTGLNPAVNHFILGGLYSVPEGTLHQFFAETRAEEEEALSGYLDILRDLDLVITYNGRHFDLPFVEKRWRRYSGSPAALPYNLDLYLVLNGHSPIKRFVPNLKQKTVENYMGLWQSREDEISGAESVELYNVYEKSHDPALGEKILLHNSDDILQLSRLLPVIGKSDFHKAMAALGFPAGPLTVRKISIGKDRLTISGQQRTCRLDYMGFQFHDLAVQSRFSGKNADFTFEVPLIRDSGLGILDLRAAGLDERTFEKYPGCSSGFLIVEKNSEKQHRELNDFSKQFIDLFLRETGLV